MSMMTSRGPPIFIPPFSRGSSVAEKSIQDFYGRLDKVLPCTDVTVAGNLRVRVFAVRAGDIVEATDQVAAVGKQAMAMLEGYTADRLGDVLPHLVKMVFTELADLVEASLRAWQGTRWDGDDFVLFDGRPSLRQMPADVAARIIVDWIGLSWSEESVRPLMRGVEALIERASDGAVKLDLWTMLSRFWSAAANAETTFSIATAPAGPTPAGPIPNSAAASPRPAT
jgi:hypothetical protein